MSRSLSVPAMAEASSPVPCCMDYRLCQQRCDRFGMDRPAAAARMLVVASARIPLVLVVAVVARALAHLAVRRMRLEERFVVAGRRTSLPLPAASAGNPTGVR